MMTTTWVGKWRISLTFDKTYVAIGWAGAVLLYCQHLLRSKHGTSLLNGLNIDLMLSNQRQILNQTRYSKKDFSIIALRVSMQYLNINFNLCGHVLQTFPFPSTLIFVELTLGFTTSLDSPKCWSTYMSLRLYP